jgi:hypothetical protein
LERGTDDAFNNAVNNADDNTANREAIDEEKTAAISLSMTWRLAMNAPF